MEARRLKEDKATALAQARTRDSRGFSNRRSGLSSPQSLAWDMLSVTEPWRSDSEILGGKGRLSTDSGTLEKTTGHPPAKCSSIRPQEILHAVSGLQAAGAHRRWLPGRKPNHLNFRAGGLLSCLSKASFDSQ